MDGSNININIINNNSSSSRNNHGIHDNKPGTSHNYPADSESSTCDVCGKLFGGVNQKFLLRRHLLTHTGERRFSCHLCSYQANQSGNLRRHIRFVHSSSQDTDKEVTCENHAKKSNFDRIMSIPNLSTSVVSSKGRVVGLFDGPVRRSPGLPMTSTSVDDSVICLDSPSSTMLRALAATNRFDKFKTEPSEDTDNSD